MKFCFWGAIAQGLEGKPIGGGEQQLALIAKTLNNLGHEVVIVDSQKKENQDINGIKVISLPKRTNNRLLKHFVFYSILKEVNADVYYARIRSSIHLLALTAAKKNRSFFIYHLASDLDSLDFLRRWAGFYSKIRLPFKIVKHIIHSEVLFPFLLRGADLIVCQNEQQSENLKKKRVKHTIIINNFFEIKRDQNNTIKNKKGTYKRYFLFIGSLDLRKGISELLTLINVISDEQFIIIGKARDMYGKNFINKILEKNNVSYFGPLPHNEVLQYILNAKALINTSVYEGFSNAFIEAWSLGVPVLSLYSNPSQVLSKFNLGVCYNGNLTKMGSNIKMDADKFNGSDNKLRLIKYVEKNHDPVVNTKKLISEIEKLC